MRLLFDPAWNLQGLRAVICGLCIAVCAPVFASAMLAMDLETLTVKADRIVVGTVESVDSHFASPNSAYIVTDVTLRSDRNVLGVPEGSKFVVRQLGGVVGEIGQRVSGEASYRLGEQVLLFAAQRQNTYYTAGMAQGAFHIQRDASGVPRVQTQLSGVELLGGAKAALKTTSPEGKTLDEVVSWVTDCLSRHHRTPPQQTSLPKNGRE